MTSVDWRGRYEKWKNLCHFTLHNRTSTGADTNPKSRCYTSDCCRSFEWRGICNIYEALKTTLSAGKHFGETRTKAGSYISRDECCTVLPNHSAVACVTFSPEGSGSQSVLRGSLRIRGYLCLMAALRFNLFFI
jgi:hypothetical protein